MDPISAFSLACNVIQVIDFGLKFASNCREIYESGSLASNDNIELLASSLRHVSEEIENEASTKTIGDAELKDLAIKSAKTSRKLLSVLEGIKTDSLKNKRSAFSKTVQTLRKKSTIDELQKQLESYQKALETRILKRLCDKLDVASLQQKNGFVSLNQSMQRMIQALATGHTRLADLISAEAEGNRKLIVREAEKTRGHATDEAEASRSEIVKGFGNLKISQADETHRKAVMDSLFFPEIYTRQESIKEAHKNTFQWIFEEHGQIPQLWSNFVEWLRHGQGIYWIRGKAGSGKSTLMNYIYAEERTRNALKIWAGQKNLLTPTFFFWNAGSTLQKSTNGLLRSLLYQILEQLPSLAAEAAQSPIFAWTDDRLSKTLLNLIRQKAHDDAICFFIDGLDEFQGYEEDLINLINDIEQNLNVKICISSRPISACQRAFGPSPGLKLEDLTREDIKKLANDKLMNTQAADLAGDLIYRADGVFLWVHLAVKDLLRGIANEDSYSELKHRLQMLPQEVEDLYLHMLNRIDPVYHDSARSFLRLLLQNTGLDYGSPISLPEFALATSEDIDTMSASPMSESDVEHLVHACQRLKTLIVVRCAGLLEFSGPPADASTTTNSTGPHQSAAYTELAHFKENTNVGFIHRSAYDFLIKDAKGIAFLNSDPSLDASTARRLFRARLFGWQLFSHEDYHNELDRIVPELFELARNISTWTGDSSETLLDLMDHILGETQHAHHKETGPTSPSLPRHWFTRVSTRREMLLGARMPDNLTHAKESQEGQQMAFVGFVAWHRAFLYVRKKLSQLPQVHLGNGASQMLLFALFSNQILFLDDLHGMEELLRCGANVSTVFKVPTLSSTDVSTTDDTTIDVTCWKVFLDELAKQFIYSYILGENSASSQMLRGYCSLADKILSQPICHGTVAEVMLVFLDSGSDYWCQSFSQWTVCGSNLFYDYFLVVEMSPAMVLNYSPGSPTDILPPELRMSKSVRVTKVGDQQSVLYDISETQAGYLADALKPCLISGNQKHARETLGERTMKVLKEVKPFAKSASSSRSSFLFED